MPTVPTTIRGDVHIVGNLTVGGSLTPPDGSVDDDVVAADAAISASKLVHQQLLSHHQANGADVASETVLLHVAYGAGTFVAIEVRPSTAPAGGDKQYTVDVQKASDASGSWTSLLSSVITLDSSSVDDTKEAGTLIGSPTYAAGQALRVVITASGSTGSQGQGCVVTAVVRESPAP